MDRLQLSIALQHTPANALSSCPFCFIGFCHSIHCTSIMHFPTTLALTALAGSVCGIAHPQDATADSTGLLDNLNRNPRGQCPQVWSQISKDLTGMFVSGGQCNDAARAAIRAVFHVCTSKTQLNAATSLTRAGLLPRRRL
jgi:hypothetical protein